MKKIGLLIWIVVLTILLIGCTQAKNEEENMEGSQSIEKEKVTVVLDWTPNTNHTGMYVALEKGYYEDSGLDVEIIQPPEGGALSLVAANKAQFAVTFQEEIGPALAAENALPVTAIATIIDHNLSGIISLKEKGIDSPKKLEGANYASWDTPFEKGILKSIVEQDGGDFHKVNLIPNTVTDVISALQTNIDAVWVYYGWDGIATELAGLETNYISIRDVNPTFDFYTPILASGNDYLQENADQVRKFLAATAKGYEFAIENPDEAAEILVNYAPEVDLALAKASQAFLANEYRAEKEQWGVIDKTRWTNFYQWMYAHDLLAKDLGSQGFTNEFLPQQEG